MPRRTLDSKTSWDDIYNYLSHVEIALSLAVDDGDKDLAPLVAPVKKLLRQVGRSSMATGGTGSER